MLRLSLFTALALFGFNAPAPADDKPPVPTAAKLTACTTGADADARAATFTASMPALKNTERMAMRFRLYERRGSAKRYRAVRVPGWGSWERSETGRPGLILTKRVSALLAPASYRAKVSLRWYGADGKVQRSRTLTTATCSQPDPRADLRLELLAAKRRDAATATYVLVVANRGEQTAPVFAVELAVDDRASATRRVGPLAGGGRERVEIVAPACAAGETVTVRLDPGHAVDTSPASDGVVRRPCPLP
jgi:hypothetical protein